MGWAARQADEEEFELVVRAQEDKNMDNESKPCKIKTCPICGGEGYSKGSDDYAYVACLSCHYETRVFDTEQEAEKQWNTRPIEDALRAEITALNERAEKAEAVLSQFREDNKSLARKVLALTWARDLEEAVKRREDV